MYNICKTYIVYTMKNISNTNNNNNNNNNNNHHQQQQQQQQQQQRQRQRQRQREKTTRKESTWGIRRHALLCGLRGDRRCLGQEFAGFLS